MPVLVSGVVIAVRVGGRPQFNLGAQQRVAFTAVRARQGVGDANEPICRRAKPKRVPGYMRLIRHAPADRHDELG